MFFTKLLGASAATCLALGLLALPSRAVENGTTYTPVTSSTPGEAYVGQVGGASAVYLGNGYVLTAAHVLTAGNVGKGIFTLDGVNYSEVTGSGEQIGSADLTLFRISDAPSLPALTLATTPPLADVTQVYLLGFGGSGNVPTMGGHAVATFGEDTITETNQSTALSPYTSDDFYTLDGTFSNGFRTFTNSAQLVAGDSGGGAFAVVGGVTELIGINEVQLLDQNNNIVGSGMVQLNDLPTSDYAATIEADMAVPEPSTWMLVGGGFGLLFGSRFRSLPARCLLRA